MDWRDGSEGKVLAVQAVQTVQTWGSAFEFPGPR